MALSKTDQQRRATVWPHGKVFREREGSVCAGVSAKLVLEMGKATDTVYM
ncbi:DNA methyltransferase [Anopheles sinensis]|uniref:DNA methyltransferase n=1 Tax=Anopheles sinensis TaxID=74873 RepID=A0A084WUQ8_ANOSI|nr:DNA methyltransferase [Anopheles sinensis]